MARKRRPSKRQREAARRKLLDGMSEAQRQGFLARHPEGQKPPLTYEEQVAESDGRRSQQDLALEMRAIREGWLIPAKQRREIMQRLVKEAKEKKNGTRPVNYCVNTILKAERQYMDALIAEHEILHPKGGDTDTKMDLTMTIRAVEESRRRVEVTVTPPAGCLSSGLAEPSAEPDPPIGQLPTATTPPDPDDESPPASP